MSATAMALAARPALSDALEHGIDTSFDAAFHVPVAARSPTDTDGLSPIVRWRASLEAFAESDRLHPPAPGGAVFVGSSSIRLWDGLEQAFPGTHVVARGFGGSDLDDSARHVDRLVLPARPRTVVVYAGENDLARGATPEAVLASYVSLVRQVHAALRATRIAFVSLKPSPLREAQTPAARRTNALIAEFTRSDPRLAFIDVFTPMLDADGHARTELFQADALHMNVTGYALWQAAIAPHLATAQDPDAGMH